MIKNVHAPVHLIDVNPVVKKRDTREDPEVLAVVQNGTVVAIVNIMIVTDIMTDTQIEDLTVVGIVIGQFIIVHVCILYLCLTSHHSSSRRLETKAEEQTSHHKHCKNINHKITMLNHLLHLQVYVEYYIIITLSLSLSNAIASLD